MEALRAIGGAPADVPSAETAEQRAAAAPHAQLIEMAIAIWRARALYAAATLGLADLLAAGPRSAEELAAETKTHAPSLYRLLRALAACGLFSEIQTRLFATMPLGAAVEAGAPGAARSTILTLAGDWQWKAWDHLLDSLRTGEPGLKSSSGKTQIDFLATSLEEGKHFNDALVVKHGYLDP